MMKSKKRYKILVLSDLKENTASILKSAVGFAEIIEADIDFFYIKKASDIVKNDNQLSAKRAINEAYFSIDKKINKIITAFTEEHNVHINHSFTVGNVKEEIGNYIDKTNPDVVILGKRKLKPIHFLGDNITNFVLKKYKGSVIIAAEKDVLEPHKKLSLGFLNSAEMDSNSYLIENLIAKSIAPIKYFRVLKKAESVKETAQQSNEKEVEFVFEDTNTISKNISNYLIKSNVNLLCLTKSEKAVNNTAFLKKIINDTDVSLLLTI